MHAATTLDIKLNTKIICWNLPNPPVSWMIKSNVWISSSLLILFPIFLLNSVCSLIFHSASFEKKSQNQFGLEAACEGCKGPDVWFVKSAENVKIFYEILFIISCLYIGNCYFEIIAGSMLMLFAFYEISRFSTKYFASAVCLQTILINCLFTVWSTCSNNQYWFLCSCKVIFKSLKEKNM